MAILSYQVLAVLVSLCVTGFALPIPDQCRTFKEDGDDVVVEVFEGTCYYFHMNVAVTFKAASSACGGRGGSLVMPKSKSVNDYLNEEMKTYREEDEDNSNVTEKFWVGMLHQESHRGAHSFFWLNGETVDSKFAQKIMEYGDAFTIPRKNGIWQFQNSDKDVKNNFVCEIEPKITTTTQAPTTTTPATKLVCPSITNDDSLTKLFGETCYYFHIQNTKSYTEAGDFCKTNGGYLAVVKTKNIDIFLKDILKNDLKRPKESLWIGLHSEDDSILPSVWDDGTPVSYTNFKYSFPIWGYYTLSDKDQWEAYPKAIRQHFICEFKALVVTVDEARD